ncbi:MAG TPA: hypothetical protein VG890_05820 [Puia sp.]|nr:hypothetical protein [Puia sp.]
MKRILSVFLFLPLLTLAQQKNTLPPKSFLFQAGGGYLFYPGSSADVQIPGYSGNPLKSGFTLELTADRTINDFLLLGLGSSFNHFGDLGSPYIPVFADIRVMSASKYQLFSFLQPGYGFFKHDYTFLTPGGGPVAEKTNGGFFIAFGFGVRYRIFYLQGKFNWFRFDGMSGDGSSSSKAYGVGGITAGFYFP